MCDSSNSSFKWLFGINAHVISEVSHIMLNHYNRYELIRHHKGTSLAYILEVHTRRCFVFTWFHFIKGDFAFRCLPCFASLHFTIFIAASYVLQHSRHLIYTYKIIRSLLIIMTRFISPLNQICMNICIYLYCRNSLSPIITYSYYTHIYIICI